MVGEEEAKSRSGNWYFPFPQKNLSFAYTILGQRKAIRASYILGSLSKDVFERRTSTGSELPSFGMPWRLDANKIVLLSFEELDLTNLNITPFSPALCLGIIDNISNLLLHHFLLIARHYIYSCKLRNTIPMVQVYTQLVIRSMEIEKQIAFDNNNLASFRKKWATFKQCPSEYNLTVNTVN